MFFSKDKQTFEDPRDSEKVRKSPETETLHKTSSRSS